MKPRFLKYLRIVRTVGFKLFLLIGTVQILMLGLLTYATVRVQEGNLMEHVLVSANRLSDMVARSARYSMLMNRKDDVHKIIASAGGQEGIEAIRIYNKSGDVVFSTHRSEVGSKVNMNAEACISCHSSGNLEDPHPTSSRLSRILSNESGQRLLGVITPIRNAPECSGAACHAHPSDKTILGVLDVKMSLVLVDARLAENRNQLLLLSAGTALVIAIISGAFIWFVVRRPVRNLMTGMELVSTGHLGQRLDVPSRDEIGQLAMAFNEMTDELARARAENTAWSHTLEAKVREKTADLEKAHRQMVQVEKMASLGNLSSSVAHELNNPLEGILTFARLLIKRIRKTALSPEEIQTYCDDLKLVADEAQRCGNIVKNLLLVARHGGMTFQSVQLKTIVDRCLLLVHHHAAMNNVTLEEETVGDDTIECDPNQIQQVIIGMMVNAIEAITGAGISGGVIKVSLRREGDMFTVKVVDNGPGMTEEVKLHVFEPFFTTKSEGKGVGLGLAIAYGIIQRHRGAVEVESAPGRGTTFSITLPSTQPAEAAARAAKSAFEGVKA